jgi:N12 class adenine-specific DNA methylase
VGIKQLKSANGERFRVKQLERTKKSLETLLERIASAKAKDTVVTFEQLGVDRLYIDESHYFKNLLMHTKLQNVAGLSTSYAIKSSDLYSKCRYLDGETGGRGCIFASATPISNSMVEMYTIQRYLQHGFLEKSDLLHFDRWASVFGETVSSLEIAPEGGGYRSRTRFSKFTNLPELMANFREVADIQTADMLNLPVPTAHYETVIVEPSDLQKNGGRVIGAGGGA